MSPVGRSRWIGRAFVSQKSQKKLGLRRGDILREGNIIRTESNGHVHIKFLDEAVMSVRPNSELHILTIGLTSRNRRTSRKVQLTRGYG